MAGAGCWALDAPGLAPSLREVDPIEVPVPLPGAVAGDGKLDAAYRIGVATGKPGRNNHDEMNGSRPRRRDVRDAELPDGSAFRSEWIEPARGIRVGHLRPQERLTQILKFRLREVFGQEFLVDRWGRGAVWSTIWFVPKANRLAKGAPGSGHFSSAKFYIGVHPAEEQFRAGFHIESGLRTSPDRPDLERKRNWDWQRFLKALRENDAFDSALRDLVRRDGFRVGIGFFERDAFAPETFEGSRSLLRAIRRRDRDEWVGVLLDYGWSAGEVSALEGPDLVDALMAVFLELAPVMNAVLEVPLAAPRAQGA